MIIRAAAGGPKNFFSNYLTVPKIVAQYQKYPIPYPITLWDHSVSLYVTKTLP